MFSAETLSRPGRKTAKRFWVVGVLGLSLLPAAAQTANLPVLLHVSEVRRLKPAEAEQGYPVRLKGVLTFVDQRTPTRAYRFIQDETAGIYFYPGTNIDFSNLGTGTLVELEGQTWRGEFAPVVVANRIRSLGPGIFPPAKVVSLDQLMSGQEDSQYVELEGIVRSVQQSIEGFYTLEIATGGGRITAYIATLPAGGGEDLVDSKVRMRGICGSQFNLRRQLFDVRLIIPRPEDLVVQESSPRTDPFAVPVQTIVSLMQFSPEGPYGHRVKVAGVVTCRQNDKTLFIQDDQEGLYVETRQRGDLAPGDRVEVLGFPAKGEYTPVMQDAVFRKIESGPEPAPDPITLDEALRGTHDCRLVRLEGTLLERAQGSGEQILVLQSSNAIFSATLEKRPVGDLLHLRNGSRLALTGVCVIEKGKDWFAGQEWRAKSFRVVLRSTADIQVLKQASWWTLGKLLWALGILGMAVLASLTWVVVLGRRVQQQTLIIRQKLQAEAALKDRYLQLFENANDVVYTHDLEGRLTSINEAGERLLQQERAGLLTRNILDLVAPEQQAAARQWLDRVVRGTAPDTVEWDFLAASGHRLRLEIGTRLVQQHGKAAEIEGIARDITERKRLEQELLEISNREQRRIGHDLHDGVCQQLVGISFLTESLAEQLAEKTLPESAVASRIGDLLSTAISQTRGVARGLFPVRLEENGLVSALEELAGNAAELFQIPCEFLCQRNPDRLNYSTALHLYYIAQEALANAAKHGRAESIRIRLEPAEDRWVLSVQDNGRGFSPAAGRQSGMGLRIMEYRARGIGATLEVQSAPGAGTTVRCIFVVEPGQQHAVTAAVQG